MFVVHTVLLQAAPTIDPAVIVAALRGHQWTLIVAFALYALALLIKQGWLGSFLQSHLPPRALPFLSPIAGVLFLSSGEMINGTPWLNALVDGLVAGFLPLIGHEVVVESARGGKELIPEKKTSAPPGPPAVSAKPIVIGTKSNPPGPPAAVRLALRGSRVFALCFVVSALTLVSGCAAASQWWQQLVNNPAATIAQLIDAVRNVITTADTVWAIASPMFGANQATATQAYEDAKVTVVNALAALQNAVKADAEAQKSNPDWSALVSDLQGAVSNLIAIVQKYTGSTVTLGATNGGSGALGHARAALAYQGTVVASWGHK